MEEARDRIPPKGYTERHHIIPRSWWDNDYLVVLTAEEHFLAHYYLAKAFPEDKSMVHALWCMCNGLTTGGRSYKVDAKIFAEARERYMETRKTDEFRSKMSETLKGQKRRLIKTTYQWWHPDESKNCLVEGKEISAYDLHLFLVEHGHEVTREGIRRVARDLGIHHREWRLLKNKDHKRDRYPYWLHKSK